MNEEPDERGAGCFIVMVLGLLFWCVIIFGVIRFVLF